MASEELMAMVLSEVTTLAMRVAGSMQDGLDELGLTGPTAQLLWILRPDGDSLPMRKLAARLGCDPSNITLLSAKLEEGGLAERRAHPRDGRARTLVLTEEGRAVRERLLAMIAKRSPLAGLSDDECGRLHVLLARAIEAA